jgi:ribosome-interacting GTPase 1
VLAHLGIVRVYARPPGKEPDLERPFVLKQGSTVDDLTRKVHKDFYEKLKYARVWGGGAFDGQMVQRDYVLKDGDVIELHI